MDGAARSAQPSHAPAALAGERLGVPLALALTGNLPVLPGSAALHWPDELRAREAAAAGGGDAARAARMMGNLAPLSRELWRPMAGAGGAAAAGAGAAAAAGAADYDDGGFGGLAPGWGEMRWPAGAALRPAASAVPTFWWNSHYRSWRAERPQRGDDGRRGARCGERDLARAGKLALRAAVLARVDELLLAAEGAGDAAAAATASSVDDGGAANARRILRAYASVVGHGLTGDAISQIPPALTPLLLMSPADLQLRAEASAGVPVVKDAVPAQRAAPAAPGEAAAMAHALASAALSGATWIELFSRAHLTPFYLDVRERRTQWQPPPEVAADAGAAAGADVCMRYVRRWALCWDRTRGIEYCYLLPPAAASGTELGVRWDIWRTRLGAAGAPPPQPPPGYLADGYPIDYDGPLLADYWQPDGAGAFVNLCSQAVAAEQPAGWPRALPDMPPPAVPPLAHASGVLAPAPRSALDADVPVVDLAALATFLRYYATVDGEGGGGGAGSGSGSGGGAAAAAAIFYGDLRGYLRKKGRGFGFLGRRSWQERYFAAARGFLSYWHSAHDCNAGTAPIKGVRINLSHYNVEHHASNACRIRLVPVPTRVIRGLIAARRRRAAEDTAAATAAAGGDDLGASSGVVHSTLLRPASVAPSSRTLSLVQRAAQRLRLASTSAGSLDAAFGGIGADTTHGGDVDDKALTLALAQRRIYDLEAPSAEAATRWVDALRGRRADGLPPGITGASGGFSRGGGAEGKVAKYSSRAAAHLVANPMAKAAWPLPPRRVRRGSAASTTTTDAESPMTANPALQAHNSGGRKISAGLALPRTR